MVASGITLKLSVFRIPSVGWWTMESVQYLGGSTRAFIIALKLSRTLIQVCSARSNSLVYSFNVLSMPYVAIKFIVSCNFSGLFLLGGVNIPRIFPVIKALRCLHRIPLLPAGQLQVMISEPESFDTVTMYTSKLLLLVAKNSYFMC